MPAFADDGVGNAQAGAGGIAGAFFNSDPMALPNAATRMAAMPSNTVAGALPAGPMPDFCGPAVATASGSHHLPSGLLNAISVVESGRPNPQSGAVKPWPWSIDANGTGYLYPTEQAAEQAAAGFEAAGITSLDIGCLQVNLAQHPDAFQSLAQAFDPAANADYAAGFLISLEHKFGNWSQTAALGGPYAARVYAQWQGTASPITLAVAGMPATGQMMAPLPLPQTTFEMSSLIPPMHLMMRPNTAMTGRGLASYRATPVAIATSQIPQG